jgi:dTDP-4-amino-4,6-dideoxygalactose transaminase
LWRRAWSYKDHGKSYDAVYSRRHAAGFRWLHESPGTNWRLTEIQSAIGRCELKKLDRYLAARRNNAAVLASYLSNIPGLRVPQPPVEISHSCYRLHACVDLSMLRHGWTRDRIIEAANAEGVPCFTGSCSEIYLEAAVPDDLRPRPRLPIARELGETSLAFLVHPTLTREDMADTAAALGKVMRHAARPLARIPFGATA